MADLVSAKNSKYLNNFSDENPTKSTVLFPMEEDGNLDSLNDETFGADSFDSEWIDSDQPDAKVDEFEKWKRQQRAVTEERIIPDEAPPRNPCPEEEKLAQAISKLDSIGILSPKKETESPLPNAEAIEALWPTSPKHSSNLASPGHSPYQLPDLPSHSHHIWGSPVSDEHSEKNGSIDAMDSLASHTKLENERKMYSPVLEDEAIVSALPKRIPTPIRVEDMEKIRFGNHVNRLPPNMQFASGGVKVRPPPGFPPDVKPRVRFPIHSSPYGPSPMPSIPPHLNAAQAQAYYMAMMNQRMPFPPHPHTPNFHQHFPRPIYHSDPGHLRQRGSNMPMPRSRGAAMTPQPRNWNGSRGGRYYDNRRRQQDFLESPSAFKYVPQYYVESEEEDEDDAGTLMTAKEKDWIIRIQLMQLTSDKPELDDYYFHTFERCRLAKERFHGTAGVGLETSPSIKDRDDTSSHDQRRVQL